MSTKSFLHEVMSLAWQFVRKNGFTMSEALKCAWANMKLKLHIKIHDYENKRIFTRSNEPCLAVR